MTCYESTRCLPCDKAIAMRFQTCAQMGFMFVPTTSYMPLRPYKLRPALPHRTNVGLAPPVQAHVTRKRSSEYRFNTKANAVWWRNLKREQMSFKRATVCGNRSFLMVHAMTQRTEMCYIKGTYQFIINDYYFAYIIIEDHWRVTNNCDES